MGQADKNELDAEIAFVKKVEQDYKIVRFLWGRKRFSFRFCGENEVPTVFLGEPQPNFALQTLHELGHALCKHKDYKTDVERLKIESAAWERAKTVYLDYYIQAFSEDGEVLDAELAKILPEWDDEVVQEHLDTYRDWLHTRSKCKKCGLTRYQTTDGEYHCPRCENFLA